MIKKTLCIWASILCALFGQQFEFKTLDLSLDSLEIWSPDIGDIQGNYYFEYGDGGGEIILKAFLDDDLEPQLQFYGVIFLPSPMLEKQKIVLLKNLHFKESKIQNKDHIFYLRKFVFQGKEIKGILYNNQLFELINP